MQRGTKLALRPAAVDELPRIGSVRVDPICGSGGTDQVGDSRGRAMRHARDGSKGMPDPYWRSVTALIPQLRAYAIALTRSSTEADDLIQETLTRAWRFRDNFDGQHLKAWLFKILRNCFHTEIASRRGVVEDVEGRAASQLSCGPEQEWYMRYRELLEAIGRLTPLCREAILLVVASGLSYEEAAHIAGCAVGTMKSRVIRARTLLVQLTGDAERSEPVRQPECMQ
jgi:RNA polymerase sigma-70 factor (ECF subfamily)